MHESHDATGPVHGVWRNDREFVVAGPAWWKNVSLMLGVIIGTGTVVGYVASQLYVPRKEFTDQVILDLRRDEDVRTLQRENGQLRSDLIKLEEKNAHLSNDIGELQRRRCR